MSKIEPHCLKWLDTDGFVWLYFSIIPDVNTCEQAYEAAERLYFDVFNRRKYSDYDTFRVILSRWNAKQKR